MLMHSTISLIITLRFISTIHFTFCTLSALSVEHNHSSHIPYLQSTLLSSVLHYDWLFWFIIFSQFNAENQFFRFISTGKHIGKVVIKVRDEEPQKLTKPVTKLVSAIPRTYMNPDKSYVLVGTYQIWYFKISMKRNRLPNVILSSSDG